MVITGTGQQQWEDMLGIVNRLEENGLVPLDEKP